MPTTVRSRSLIWMATGMALALVLTWSFSAWRASASFEPGESTLVPVTPTRILDTRDPVDLGLPGPFVSAVSQDLMVTGDIPTSEGVQTVVPAGATGVVLNVTVVEPTADGFISVRPADAPGAPSTSSLNFEAGDITPNAVSVQVPTSGPDAGMIEITYDAFSTPGPTADVLIDLVAYTSSSGLADIAARVTSLEADLSALQGDVAGKQDACAPGAILGYAQVQGLGLSSSLVDVTGAFNCTAGSVQARREATGEYWVRFEGLDATSTTEGMVVHVTSIGNSGGRITGYGSTAANGDIRVNLFDNIGDPVDAVFSISLLDPGYETS